MERMRSIARLGPLCAGAMTLLALAGCTRTPAAAAPQSIRYLSYTSRSPFTNDLVRRLSSIPNVQVTTEETAGSLAVLSMLEQGHGDFGFSQADVAYIAYRRGIDPDLHPFKNLRAVAVRWVNTLWFAVPRSSPVRSIGDLRRKRVGIVPVGAAGELLTRIVFEAHGLTYADFQPVFIDNDKMLEAIGRGTVDAVVIGGTPVIERGLEIRQSGLRHIGIAPAIINSVRGNYPFVKRIVDPDAAASGAAIQTVGVDSVLICRKDMSEPLVYELTKEFHALLTQNARALPQAQIDPEQASATPIPLHPGAARFYREREILR